MHIMFWCRNATIALFENEEACEFYVQLQSEFNAYTCMLQEREHISKN